MSFLAELYTSLGYSLYSTTSSSSSSSVSQTSNSTTAAPTTVIKTDPNLNYNARVSSSVSNSDRLSSLTVWNQKALEQSQPLFYFSLILLTYMLIAIGVEWLMATTTSPSSGSSRSIANVVHLLLFITAFFACTYFWLQYRAIIEVRNIQSPNTTTTGMENTQEVVNLNANDSATQDCVGKECCMGASGTNSTPMLYKNGTCVAPT